MSSETDFIANTDEWLKESIGLSISRVTLLSLIDACSVHVRHPQAHPNIQIQSQTFAGFMLELLLFQGLEMREDELRFYRRTFNEEKTLNKPKQNTGRKKPAKVIPISDNIDLEEYQRAIKNPHKITLNMGEEAKIKALRALMSYRYVDFAGWARVWSQFNIATDSQELTPFKPLANLAGKLLRDIQKY